MKKMCIVMLPTIGFWGEKRVISEIIMPVLHSIPDYDIVSFEMTMGIKDDDRIKKQLLKADLCIIESQFDGGFWFGIRSVSGLPTITMARDARGVVNNADIKLPISKAMLWKTKEHIQHTLRKAIDARISSGEKAIIEKNPVKGEHRNRSSSILVAAERIDEVVEVLYQLRINSFVESIEELSSISAMLKGISSESVIDDKAEIIEHALYVVSNLLNTIGSRSGIKVIVSGAIAGILGGSGWPAATVYALTLAAWEGSAALKIALDRAFTHQVYKS